MTLAVALWLALSFLASEFSYLRMIFVNALHYPEYRRFTAWYLTPVFLEFLGIFTGGMAGARSRRNSARTDLGNGSCIRYFHYYRIIVEWRRNQAKKKSFASRTCFPLWEPARGSGL
jgi:hypothetical protein